ncbi:MAG TPA: proline iminopeptidase-family hydrolase [Phnomibacter sp.]|nr:proline iminopeptidase-family hydrolase [Phnomibacter sp.]
MKNILLIACIAICLAACKSGSQQEGMHADYFARTDSGLQTGGVKMIPIETPKGTFNVWTKRIGNNPRIKLLLLHGGPGGTHEEFECFESFMPAEGIEIIEYDQLDSYYSDQPNDSSLWTTERFVEEVEQVRKAIGADSSNFYVLGHSWGGILAMEYALKYQQHIKGLVISNMMSDVPAYGKYAEEVLAKQMDPKVLDTIRALEAKSDFGNPKYMQLLMPNFYDKHVCRVVPNPEPIQRCFKHLNPAIYVCIQGPSEFGVSGRLAQWSRAKDLPSIQCPTLVIGANHDTMDPEHMKWMATQVKNGRSLICPNGSHFAMWDDQEVYFKGLISFIQDVDAGKPMK